jgi:peptide/nickel transport system permease protein
MRALRAGLRRLAVFVGTALVASVVVFLIVQALPGDVALASLGLGGTAEQAELLRQRWGLDRPLALRYGQWLVGMLHGDFGASYLTGQSVASQIAPRLGVTAWLVGLSIPWSAVVAIPLGLVSAMLRRRWVGAVVNAASHVGLAVPVFFAGTMVAIVFAVELGWLPANGYVAWRDSPAGWAASLVLPVASIAIVQGCFLARYVRAGCIEVLSQDYYRTARAVGWTKWAAVGRHGTRNMAISLVTVVGLQVSALLVGAILVEQVFVLPGLGSLLLSAVAAHDLMVIQGVAMLLVFVVLAVNLLVDLAWLAIDPRLRRGAAR